MSDNATHTTGPWEIHEGSYSGRKGEFSVWPVGSGGMGDKRVACWIRTEADARLIAAAPELLSALIGLMQRSPHHDGEIKTDSGIFAYAAAKAAVAKATGESSGTSGEVNSPAISESCDGVRATSESLGFKDPYKVGQMVRFYGLEGTYSITNGVWVRSHNCVWSFRVSAICRTGDDEGKVVLMPAENVAWASDVRCLV